MLEIYRYKDLQNAGYGTRNTIKSKVKKEGFPEPDFDDGEGHPCWTRETVENWKASRKPYISSTPAQVNVETLRRSQRRSKKASIAV